MKEILLTSSALILALLALRQLFRRTVSRRMQYALWLLVLVRLLVPVNVGTLAHNVLSAAAQMQAVDYTPYEGMQVRAKVETVLLRGQVLMENGRLTAETPMGQYLIREPFHQETREE